MTKTFTKLFEIHFSSPTKVLYLIHMKQEKPNEEERALLLTKPKNATVTSSVISLCTEKIIIIIILADDLFLLAL